MSLSSTFTGVFAVATLGLFGLLIKGNKPEKVRLGEISKQTAKEAEPRVIVYGRVRPIGGNLMYCQEPVKRFVKQKVEGGKGGGSKKQEQKVENVFRTYAMGVCEGPITGFTRIWRNNKLVYDARGNAWGEENNPVFLRQYRLYLGGWNQLPSPDLEKIWGVGNVTAHRGTAYIVAVDENLTETNGMVPQWIFEVERAEGVFYTSKPYAVEAYDIFSASHASGLYEPLTIIDSLSQSSANVISITLREPVYPYSNWPAEGINTSYADVKSITLVQPIIDYKNWEPDRVQVGSASVTSISIRVAVVTYTNWPVEAISASALEIKSGRLE